MLFCILGLMTCYMPYLSIFNKSLSYECCHFVTLRSFNFIFIYICLQYILLQIIKRCMPLLGPHILNLLQMGQRKTSCLIIHLSGLKEQLKWACHRELLHPREIRALGNSVLKPLLEICQMCILRCMQRTISKLLHFLIITTKLLE